MLKTTIKEDEARTQERQRNGIIRSPPRRCHVGQKRRATRSAGRGRSHRFPILLPLWSPGLLCRPFLLSLPLSPWSLTRGLSPNSSGLLSWLYVEEDNSVLFSHSINIPTKTEDIISLACPFLRNANKKNLSNSRIKKDRNLVYIELHFKLSIAASLSSSPSQCYNKNKNHRGRVRQPLSPRFQSAIIPFFILRKWTSKFPRQSRHGVALASS